MGSANEIPWHKYSHVSSQPTIKEEENMAMSKDEPWLSLSAPPPNVHIRVHGVSFHLNKRCMASRSAKLAYLLESNNHICFTDIPSNTQTFVLVARFCYGHDLQLSPSTVVPLACVAFYLEMTEEHFPNNLLNKTLSFITTRILPYWNETLVAFNTIDTQLILDHAQSIGLVHACIKSISEKASSDPSLLTLTTTTSKASCSSTITTARRKLFVNVEDLTNLSLPIYQLAVSALLESCYENITLEHLTQCLYRYAKKWVLTDNHESSRVGYKREVIEIVEKLMPKTKGAIHVKLLFELLRSAMYLHCSQKCRAGFEARIGEQLPEASAQDLCIPFNSTTYAKETKYDTKCVTRILSHFSMMKTSCSSISDMEAVSEILEDFLAETAKDVNLRKDEFVSILQVLVLTVLERIDNRSHDGVYRAIDVYLVAHGFLTENESEEICRYLDYRRLSVEASEHAARNERLPLRAVAQVLFVGQLRIRKAIGELREDEVEFEEEEEEFGGDEEEEEEEALKEMDGRVSKLENEYGRMKKEIVEKKCGDSGEEKGEKKNGGSWKLNWKEIRDMFGCKNSIKSVECNCQVNEQKHVTSKSKSGRA